MHQRDPAPQRDDSVVPRLPVAEAPSSTPAALDTAAFSALRTPSDGIPSSKPPPIPEPYIVPKWFEPVLEPLAVEKWGNGRIYELLGTRLYKFFVPTGGDLAKRWGDAHEFTSGTRVGTKMEDQLGQYRNATKSLEAVHWALGAAFAAMTLAHFVASGGASMLLIGSNVLVNLYPIMTQRYNRVRIDSVLARRAELRAKRENSPADSLEKSDDASA